MSSPGGRSNSRAYRWPAYTAAAIVLGAQQSPIDVTEAIPARASRSGCEDNAAAKASFGTRELTETTEAAGTFERRPVKTHWSAARLPSNSIRLQFARIDTPSSSRRF